MSDIQSLVERGRNLLGQAFKQCDIPERSGDEYPPKLFGGNVYSETTDNDIGIVFSYYHAGAGSVYCSISLNHLAVQTAREFENDAEAVEALVDTLNYLESAVSGFLPTAQHKLLRRVFNLSVRPKTDKEQQRGWITILEQLAPNDRRTETERKLAAERDWRGGARNIKHVWTDEDRACLARRYEELKPVWLDAKEIAKEAQKSRVKNRKTEWRAEVLRTYPHLPTDLLESFSAPRGGAKPSDNAVIHASRECRITPGISPRRLREVLTAWNLKHAPRTSTPKRKARKVK